MHWTFTYAAIEAVYGHLSHVPNRYRARVEEKKVPEVGGILLGKQEARIVYSAQKIANVSGDPVDAYSPSPREMSERLAQLEVTGLELVGTYHDHPWGRAVMSQADSVLAQQSGLLLVVAAPMDDGPDGDDGWEWGLFDPDAGGQVELKIAPPLSPI